MKSEKYGNVIEIWAPRYKDNMVLISTTKVKTGENYLTFTKASHLSGQIYKFDGNDVRKSPTQKNGKGFVFVYPMIKLERVE